MKKLFLFLSIFLIIIFFGRNLNPFSNTFFTFHDSTQPTRIHQFVNELKSFHIPPRVASHMNYQLGYPIFNFYAPFSYWLTSGLNLLGLDIINSLKLSFLLAILTGFISTFLFLSVSFELIPAILGGLLYISSLYFPLNIFVRGNLAEIWFIALLPLALFLIKKNSLKNSNKLIASTALVFSFLFTSHNVLSILSLPLIIVFIFLFKNRKQNILSLIISLITISYFWLPALTEMKYTWAKDVATLTKYQDHFLCSSQLWQSNWGYGGSTVGCENDGMSFMIGKIQLITGIIGILYFLFSKKKNNIYLNLFLILATFFSLFLTTYQSKFIWNLFSPLLSIIQFPWRLIGLSLIGLSYFSSFFLNSLRFPIKNIVFVMILIIILSTNSKYFKGQQISKKLFEKQFLSQTYIESKSAYAVAEYLPKTIDYKKWRNLENKKLIPLKFFKSSTILPFSKDKQTPIEITGNIISLIGVTLIVWIILRKKQLFQH